MPNDSFTFEEAQEQTPENFSFEEAAPSGDQAGQGLVPLPAGFKLPIPPEFDPQTLKKRDLGLWTGGPWSPAFPEQMAEGASLLKAPLAIPAQLFQQGIVEPAGEMFSDFLRRTGIAPSAAPGVPLAEPLPPGGGEMLAQSILAPFTKAGAPAWATGALKEGGEFLRGLTEPGQVATLPAAAVSEPIQAGYFAGALAGIPESIEQIAQAQNPEQTGRAITGAIANLGMAELMRRGLLQKTPMEELEDIHAKEIREDKGILPEGGQVPQEGEGISRPDIYQPGGRPEGAPPQEAAQVKPKVPEIKSIGPAEAGGKDMHGNPLGTKYYATPEDWAKWNDLRAQIQKTKAAGDMGAAFELMRENETLKNKYGGNPPEPPKEPAPEEEPEPVGAAPDVLESKVEGAGKGKVPNAFEFGKAVYVHLQDVTDKVLADWEASGRNPGEKLDAPSFSNFQKDMRKAFPKATPGALADVWKEMVWKRLLNASGAHLEALRQALNLRTKLGARAIPEPMGKAATAEELAAMSPDARQQAQAERQGAEARDQYRMHTIAAIGEKLAGQANKSFDLTRKAVTPEDIGFGRKSARPAWNPISDEERTDPHILAAVLTDDAREEGINVSNTKRLTVLQNKDSGKVSMVSTYRDPRRGAVLIDPDSPAQRHAPLEEVLKRWRPVYSVLLDQPIKRFHQKFDSLIDFEEKFGRDARERSYTETQKYSEGPPTEFQPEPEGIASWASRVPVTPTEADAIFNAIEGEVGVFDNPDDVKSVLMTLSDPRNQRRNPAAVSGFRKLAQRLQQQFPDLSVEDLLDKLANNLYENHTQAKTLEEFEKRTMAQGPPPRGEAAAPKVAEAPKPSPIKLTPEAERLIKQSIPRGTPEVLMNRVEAQETANENAQKPTAEVGHGGETGVELARHNTPSGLPPGVHHVGYLGGKFAGELLEASRQLGTLIRSRVTLPKGVLGAYSRRRSSIGNFDQIEVGNIRNQSTMAHEMGHDLDALIWPRVNLDRSQKSLGERVAGVSAKELSNELTKVSELMRGPMTGSPGHVRYRKSATELVADFFSLYAHDPQWARRLAPKFAKGFEESLALRPDAAGVIHQLLEGKVTPVPGERVKGPTAQPGVTPGAVPAREEGPLVPRDETAAASGENLVKGLVRLYKAQRERARILADKWRGLVPKREERQDVGAFIEGIGNVEIPGDTIEAVEARMTPAMQDMAKDFRLEIEAQRNEINQYLKDSEEGEYINFLEDYLPHFYANAGGAKGRAAIGRFVKDSPNAKARKLPTYQEAKDLGLIPITQDPAVLYEHHANINWRVATNRMLMHELKDMKDAAGDPVVVPAKDAPAGWHITNNPLVQKVYARGTPNGVIIWKGGAAIHPDVWRSVRQMLDTPVSGDFGKAYDALNGFSRANAFAFSFFHDITLRAAALGSMFELKNPLRGLVRIMERDPSTGELRVLQSTIKAGQELMKNEEFVAQAALDGLQFSYTESDSYQHNARDFLEKVAAQWREVPVLGTAARLARDIQQMRQEWLWKNTHDALKIVSHFDATSKALAKAPKGISTTAVREQIASLFNDAYGGQEWQTKFWLSPAMRHNMSRFFLAPDWSTSTLRSVPGVSDFASIIRRQAARLGGRGPGRAAFEGTAGNLGRTRFWGGELAALATATLAAQYAIYTAFGDKEKGDHPWVWQNEPGNNRRVDITPLLRKLPWHDQKDPTRYYMNLGKRPEEVLGWVIHPEQNIYSKMSRPVQQVFQQITGYEGDFKAPWKQDHETFLESIGPRALSLSKEFVPFVFSGNQFALSLPYRKGMTKYKSLQAYESVYELAAEPNALTPARAFLRGVPDPQGSLQGMVEEISEAARANGVPAETIRKRALSEVRGHHYDLFFKAFQKGDHAAMEKEAEALERLGATQKERMESLRKRQALQPQLPY